MGQTRSAAHWCGAVFVCCSLFSFSVTHIHSLTIGKSGYMAPDYGGSGDLVFQADNRHQNVCLGKFHKMGSSTYSIHINHSVKRTVGIVYRYRQHQTQTDEFCLGVTICRLYKKFSVVAFRKVLRLMLSIPIYSSR